MRHEDYHSTDQWKTVRFFDKERGRLLAHLRDIEVLELFEERTVRVTNEEGCWLFNPQCIEKILFDLPEDAHCWSPENVLSRRFISEDSFREKLAARKQQNGSCDAQSWKTEIADGLAELTLASGSVEYLEYLIMLRPPREQLMDLSLIFQKPAHPIPRDGGGVVLLNPRNIASVRIYSKMIEPPVRIGSWNWFPKQPPRQVMLREATQPQPRQDERIETWKSTFSAQMVK
jgi:hypothetical protein